jgi:HlyD family secretion protein
LRVNGLFAWIMGLAAAIIPGLGHSGPPGWNGYVEDDYTYASPASAGTIASIAVTEGQTVKKGAVLFVLDTSQQQPAYDAAKAQADAAQATLANLQTGERPEEIAVMAAQLQKAESDLALAQQSLSRTSDLFRRGNAPQSDLDTASSAVSSAQSAVDTLKAQIAVAQLPARDQQQQAAHAQFIAAQAQAQTAVAALAARTVTAPEDGRVERLFYKAGEVAAAGASVVSMSGADAMKVEFYVNEADRNAFKLGTAVAVSCDGCPAGLTATVSFLASDPEFTPPIIYSRDERSRLTYLTEATLADRDGIQPGQPVTVELAP